MRPGINNFKSPSNLPMKTKIWRACTMVNVGISGLREVSISSPLASWHDARHSRKMQPARGSFQTPYLPVDTTGSSRAEWRPETGAAEEKREEQFVEIAKFKLPTWRIISYRVPPYVLPFTPYVFQRDSHLHSLEIWGLNRTAETCHCLKAVGSAEAA
jgi:hypothetical protein